MRKEIILLFALFLVLASCGETPTITNEKSFIGGTDGLIINFVEGEPPAEVTDGGATPFTVSIKLENKGETLIPAEDVTLTLKGIDAPTFGITNDDLTMNPSEDLLENDINPDTGAAINSPPVYITFPELNFMNELSGNSVFPFMVDVCYKYETLATSKLCIKENLLDSADTDVCTVTGYKDIQNSGAPVQITSFEEFSAGQNAVSFSFNVKNVGNGILSAMDSDCDETPAGKNYVRITVDTHIDGLTCSGLSNPTQDGTSYSGDVKLATGERQVRCTQQLSESDMTDKVMVVDFSVDYDYMESKSTSVLVKHI